MKLKDYGRTQKKHKQFVKKNDLHLIGIDISKAKHDACFDQTNQTIAFADDRAGYKRSEEILPKNVKITGEI